MKSHGYAPKQGKRESIYMIWQQMKQRCENPRNKSYATYGARGIKVCARWRKFENFLADMGMRPEGMTIERVENNGSYEPSNCRWATQQEQANNRPDTKRIEFNGEILSLRGWARKIGVADSTLHARLSKGWPLDIALTSPPILGVRHDSR